MSLGKLILAEVRHSARRAHRHFRAGEADEGRQLARRIATLLASLRESYDTDVPLHQMVREAVRRGLPEAYVADVFVHDREQLERMAAEDRDLRFVWVLHACGSNLLDARESQTPSYLAESFLRRTDNCHVFLFEGGMLTKCASNSVARAA
jgi:hypothetical protein